MLISWQILNKSHKGRVSNKYGPLDSSNSALKYGFCWVDNWPVVFSGHWTFFCNCRRKDRPLENNGLTTSIVYNARVASEDNITSKKSNIQTTKIRKQHWTHKTHLETSNGQHTMVNHHLIKRTVKLSKKTASAKQKNRLNIIKDGKANFPTFQWMRSSCHSRRFSEQIIRKWLIVKFPPFLLSSILRV